MSQTFVSTTNILSLPVMDGANTSFTVAINADWRDSIFFSAPGSVGPITLVGCSFTNGSNVITVSSTSLLSPDMPITSTPGIPFGTYVGAITSATALTMVDANGVAANATATNNYASLIFQPVPIDLTGINFIASLRSPNNQTRVFLTAQTGDGTMTNGGSNGMLSFSVPKVIMAQVPIGPYVIDILAIADNSVVNLLPTPAMVTVNQGAADSALVIH